MTFPDITACTNNERLELDELRTAIKDCDCRQLSTMIELAKSFLRNGGSREDVLRALGENARVPPMIKAT